VRWLNRCLREHNACRTHLKTRVLPRRLIQIGPPGTSLRTRLVETDQLPLSTQYIALSHRWGTETFFCLKQANINNLKQNIPLWRLSKVFQDAIVVLRRFGMLYIWIDSLCIVQDQLEDWQTESSKMGDVYRNSLLNIAATGFRDGRNGLFVERDPLVMHTERISINADIIWEDKHIMRSGPYISMDSTLWRHEVADAPLNRRAWVVQERLLSPRTLHFGHNQLLWECYECESCEPFPEELPGAVIGLGFKPTFLLKPSLKRDDAPINEKWIIWLSEFWGNFISVYTTGNLSHEEDKLVAISGLAARLQGYFLEAEYLTGLWKWNLVHQLLWETHPESIMGRTFSQRPKKYRAPSWSWASVDGEIVPWRPSRDKEKAHVFANVIDVEVTTVNHDPFG
jgi:hypothetical protein